MFDLLLVRKNLKNFGDELTKVRREIELVTREIEDVGFAPLPVSDVLDSIEYWATAHAAEYRKHLRGVIGGISARPSASQSEIYAHLCAAELLPQGTVNRPLSRDKQLCGLLGPAAVVELMKKQIDGLDLPAPGLPRAQRSQAIAGLEKKLVKLRKNEADLLAEAERAGLDFS